MGIVRLLESFQINTLSPKSFWQSLLSTLPRQKCARRIKKEETERERMERLNRENNDIDWVGLYNSDKLSSLKVDELSLYFSRHKITFKGKKAEKVAMIKEHVGSL